MWHPWLFTFILYFLNIPSLSPNVFIRFFFCLLSELVGHCYLPILSLSKNHVSFLIQLDNVSAGTTKWKGLLGDYWTRFKSYCEQTSNVHIHQVCILSSCQCLPFWGLKLCFHWYALGNVLNEEKWLFIHLRIKLIT